MHRNAKIMYSDIYFNDDLAGTSLVLQTKIFLLLLDGPYRQESEPFLFCFAVSFKKNKK